MPASSEDRSRRSRSAKHHVGSTRGQRLDDVFFGPSPPAVDSVIDLARRPRTVHLRVHALKDTPEDLFVYRDAPEETVVALPRAAVRSVPLPDTQEVRREETGEDNLTLDVALTPIAEIPGPLRVDEVRRELEAFLAEEDRRVHAHAFRAEALRRELRAALRAQLHQHPPAQSAGVHQRVQRSRRASRTREHARERVLYRTIRPLHASVPHPGTTLRDVSRELQPQSAHASADVHIVADRVRARIMPGEDVAGTHRSLLVAPPIPWRAVRSTRTSITQPRRRRFTRESLLGDPRVRRARLVEAMWVAAGAVGVGLVVGTIGSLATLPRLTRVVATTAEQGAQYLAQGFKAISVADVAASQDALAHASQLFTQAERELTSQTNLATQLLVTLDPHDRLRSGRTLLDAGRQLSALGQDAGKLVLLFQGTSEHEGRSLADTLQNSVPLLQSLAAGLRDVDGLLQDVSPGMLPEERRADLAQLRDGAHTLSQVVDGFLDSHDVLLELLGAHRDRQYLVAFQNNRELRPTGGFLGSFAVIDVSRGEVRKVHVDTIYNPDGQLPDRLIPPAPLRKVTDRWFTRDANWFADFRRSARKIATLFEHSGGPTVDGVITVTPTVLERLLRVTGPIAMPAYGVTVTADNVVDETQRLVTYEYDRKANAPKAFIADLVPEILARVVTLPRERWGDLVGVLADSLQEKHILLSLRNDRAQSRVEKLGWGGVIEETDGDYLMRVEANIGGSKTDGLIEQSVDYDVTFQSDGSATATLVTTRHHQGSREGRPDLKPHQDWTRLPNVVYERTLVPHGSVLLEARGFTAAGDVPKPFAGTADYRTYQHDPELAALEEGSVVHQSGTEVGVEDGKTSFSNWVMTQPGETTVTVYRYRLPLTVDLRALLSPAFRYSLLLQSQPGHQPVTVRATVRAPAGFRIAWAGPDGHFSFEGERKATFTSAVSRDRLWGIVAERL